MTDGPLIVQSDKTLLLEIAHPDAPAARANIAPFAELERSPEHIHTYRITPLALWNARAAGHDAEQVVDALVRWSRFPVPQALLVDVVDTMARYGRLVLQTHPAHGLILVSRDRAVLEEILRHKKIAPMLGARIDQDTVVVHPPSAAGSSRRCSRSAGPPRTWPATSTARRTRSRWTPTAGSCARTSGRPSRDSGPAAPASSCCPAARARRWSARPRWPRPGAPR